MSVDLWGLHDVHSQVMVHNKPVCKNCTLSAGFHCSTLHAKTHHVCYLSAYALM
jgi:hypothetical protein